MLYSAAKKSKRISHSTSHGETLACVGGSQVAQMCALRLTEIVVTGKFSKTPSMKPTPLRFLKNFQNQYKNPGVLRVVEDFQDSKGGGGFQRRGGHTERQSAREDCRRNGGGVEKWVWRRG